MKRTTTIAASSAGVAALVASFLIGMNVGDDDSADNSSDAAGPASAAARPAFGPMKRVADCDALVDWYVERGTIQVGPRGWQSSYRDVYFNRGYTDLRATFDSGLATAVMPQAALGGKAPSIHGSYASNTGTNIQERGVDEPDVAKTDGSMVYRIVGDELRVTDVTGDKPVPGAQVTLPRLTGAQLLLTKNRVIVLGQVDGNPYDPPSSRMLTFDISDPSSPQLTDDREYDADVISAQLSDGVVRVVLSKGLPTLDFVTPRGSYTTATAVKKNKEVVAATTIDDWLPHVTTYTDDVPGDPQLAMDCSSVELPKDGSDLGAMAIVGFDPEDPNSPSATGVATSSQIVYSSPDRLYLAQPPAYDWGWSTTSQADEGMTSIHAFKIDGPTTTYVASGKVAGRVDDRWSMDSVDGHLRVVVSPTSATGRSSSVLTLAEDGSALKTVGVLRGIGRNEELKSVRWFDQVAIIVTYRYIDPMYVVDLTDDTAPKVAGELKIPGFSEYLHPLGNQRIIGLGENNGAQAGFFDVSDWSNPRQLDTVDYGSWSSQALATAQPHQFTWLPDPRVALTVIRKGNSAWVSLLHLADNHMTNEMIPVGFGDSMDAVRTLPLPDGRVVLTTDRKVAFVDVSGS